MHLIQIREYFKTFTDAHFQLHSFGFGDISKFNGKQDTRYPMLWVHPLSADMVKNDNSEFNQMRYTFYVLCVDMLTKTQMENDDDVLNDTSLILFDLVKEIEENWDGVTAETSSMVPVYEKYSDFLNGWRLQLQITVNVPSSTCNLPLTGIDYPVINLNC